MAMKIRIGIIFGGSSREREISFAGGRTVYDNLNKAIFEPIPIFVDSFNNFVLLDWHFVYKGSIRDFYPPVEFIQDSPNMYQVYAESLGAMNNEQVSSMCASVGKQILSTDLHKVIDFAFLCLHGSNGEDGRLQGMLEWLDIPYSGSGILSSSLGMNKAIQKDMMVNANFSSPKYIRIKRNDWVQTKTREIILKEISNGFDDLCVVKPANQGSSIGVSIEKPSEKASLVRAIDKAFFIRHIDNVEWSSLDDKAKVSYVKSLCDIREGLGAPLYLEHAEKQILLHHPEQILEQLNSCLAAKSTHVVLKAKDSEQLVIIEDFIHGKEFSCIVIEDEKGNPIALPPTEIRKGKELFDYRSKYLPGLSRKITPIDLPAEQLNKIRVECERLFVELKFNVYARIDGFINDKGEVFLNDPNTTSGMMPSSFFFHQAVEIGLNPSQFITFIIRSSLSARMVDMMNSRVAEELMTQLDSTIVKLNSANSIKIKIAVIMGGYSSERHISIESGRNIFEKLASSEKYEPIPIFLTGNDQHFDIYQIPINILLKDNADDIKEKTLHHSEHPVVNEIRRTCAPLMLKYAGQNQLVVPHKINFNELADNVDAAFIALHGRPGEDGKIQQQLEAVGIPYNGSGIVSSQLTIDKFQTNEVLKQHGFQVAKHAIASKGDWLKDPKAFLQNITQQFEFPFIAKPIDDGCSSAVKKIHSEQELIAFTGLMFRDTEELPQQEAAFLKIKLKEEFPVKQAYLVEELIARKDADNFIEITGGMLSHVDDDGKMQWEVFQPSEALSEGDVLSLEEKFLAGQGQNITPARYSKDKSLDKKVSDEVRKELEQAAVVLGIEGYARIDAFVRIYKSKPAEVIFIEVNSLPGMTPATCIFHQTAINGYKPYDFIDSILDFGMKKQKMAVGAI